MGWQTDRRMNDTYENRDHSRPWLRVGLVDQLLCFGIGFALQIVVLHLVINPQGHGRLGGHSFTHGVRTSVRPYVRTSQKQENALQF